MGGKKGKGKPRKDKRRDQEHAPQTPPSAPMPAAATPTNESKPETKAGDSYSQDEAKLPEANWITWAKGSWKQLGVAAVAMGTVIGAWAAVEMRNSANEQLILNKLEQSPQLTFVVPYVAPPVEGERLHGRIVVRNTGKQPATIRARRVGVAFSPIMHVAKLTSHSQDAGIDCSIRYEEMGKELSGPDAHRDTNLTVLANESEEFDWSSSQRLTWEEVAKFNGQGCGFALIAHVEYLSPHGTLLETSSCYFYTLNQGIAIKLPRYDRTEKDKDRPFPKSSAIPWTEAEKAAAEAEMRSRN